MDDVLLVVGGIIPDQDIDGLKKAGVAAVFQPGTPMDAIIEFHSHQREASRRNGRRLMAPPHPQSSRLQRLLKQTVGPTPLVLGDISRTCKAPLDRSSPGSITVPTGSLPTWSRCIYARNPTSLFSRSIPIAVLSRSTRIGWESGVPTAATCASCSSTSAR